MIHLLAPSVQQADWWCKQQEPPITLRDVHVYVSDRGSSNLFARRLSSDDRVVIYNIDGIRDQRNGWKLLDELGILMSKSPDWNPKNLEFVS